MALEAQDNPFTSILMVEAADPEALAGDADPAAGQRRLVVGTDHLLYLLDDSGVKHAVGSGGGAVATDAIWDAKGDLAGGTGANTASKLTVGANDTILMADSAQSTGLKWVASQTPSTQAFSDAAAEGTADTYARGDHKHAMPASPGGGSGARVWLARQTASSSAQLDFTSFISSTYDTYIFECISIRPATDGAMFVIRVGTGGGPTYDTSGNYNYGSLWKMITNNAVAQWGAAGATYMSLFNDSAGTALSNTAGVSLQATIQMYNPASSSLVKMFRWNMLFNYATDDNHYMVDGAGIYAPSTAVTAVRFLMSTGNIASGTVDVYGITHA
jgi:hypothetical protein